MAHKQSAIKHLRQTKKRTVANTNVKKSLAYLRKQAQKAIEQKDERNALTISTAYQKTADRAARKNIIKKNTAARRTSQLMQGVARMKSAKK